MFLESRASSNKILLPTCQMHYLSCLMQKGTIEKSLILRKLSENIVYCNWYFMPTIIRVRNCRKIAIYISPAHYFQFYVFIREFCAPWCYTLPTSKAVIHSLSHTLCRKRYLHILCTGRQLSFILIILLLMSWLRDTSYNTCELKNKNALPHVIS
jgi:hypothetical protein